MRHLMLAFCSLLPVATTSAQDPVAPRPADVATIDGIVTAVYEAISGPAGVARDWDRLRTLFVPDARMMPTGRRADGSGVRRSWSLEEYITAAGPGLVSGGFFEREIGRRTDRFGNVVQLFSAYESRRSADDPKPFMRGINSFQLWYDGSRWWVISILWENESATLPIPEQYLTNSP